jgi:hypothetical protein
MGATVKLCNNLMLGINLVGVCEAFTLGAKAGVDAQTMAEYPFFLYQKPSLAICGKVLLDDEPVMPSRKNMLVSLHGIAV